VVKSDDFHHTVDYKITGRRSRLDTSLTSLWGGRVLTFS